MAENVPRTILTVSEFLRLTRLGADETLRMLGAGELSFVAVEGRLQIDVSNVTPESLARRSIGKPATDPEHLALLEEVVASELVAALETIADEALDLALRWQRTTIAEDDSSSAPSRSNGVGEAVEPQTSARTKQSGS